jgi:RNA polymerase sigma factor (sigma-70 family)
MEHTHNQSITALDASFIGTLYEQHALLLMSYVRRHVPSREDAEDIVLEVFLATLQRQELFQLPEENQLAWLLRVAHNKIADYHRGMKKRPVANLDNAATTVPAGGEQDPDQLALRHEEEALLREHLSKLPMSYQLILQLRFGDGLRTAEIASRLNKSSGAVRMMLTRALNSLRETYSPR